MKRLHIAALLMSFSPGIMFGATKSARAISDTDVPATVGIDPDLPYVTPGGVLGHWGVGNGGDWMRINFARAREYAANVVLRINPISLSRIQNEEVRNWILKNQKFLAADILKTEHVWVTEEKPTCAWTVPPGESGTVPTANPIQFSYPTCRQQLKCSGDSKPVDPNAPINFIEVAQLLIHEATHHFNASETTADLVAIGVIDAWQSGLMDSIPLALDNAPAATFQHTAVWTGDRMVVIGGDTSGQGAYVNTVAIYDPAAQAPASHWTQVVVPQWFTARVVPQAVWTGSEVFIWGGFTKTSGGKTWAFDGALFNPKTGSWTRVDKPATKDLTWNPDTSYPNSDYEAWQTVVWTGDKAIVFGGYDTTRRNALGGFFDPATRSWSSMNIANAPLVHRGHSSVWTGQEMIVWGGYNNGASGGTTVNTGGTYSIATNSWLPLPTQDLDIPYARAGHQAVWTGSKMVIISGGGAGTPSDVTSSGAFYDPVAKSWRSYKTELMAERVGHRAVWNGEEILIVGGQSKRLQTYLGEVYAFNPETFAWRILPTSTSAQAPGRYYGSIVWTGSSALVWGGADKGKTGPTPQQSGGMYFP